MKKTKRVDVIRAAFPHTIPVMAGYLVLSLAYGIMMESKGYSPLWATLVSFLAYGGSMQYAAVEKFTTAFDPVGSFILSLTINARYLFCSVGMLNKFSKTGKFRPFLFFSLSDESFAVAATVEPPKGIPEGPFYFWVFFLNYLYWGVGTLFGGLIGTLIPFDTTGLDFALTAMYVAMLIDLLRDKKSAFCGLTGVFCSVIALIVFGTQNLVIFSLVLILLVLIPARRLKI